MNSSSDAAESIVRMSLQGTDVNDKIRMYKKWKLKMYKKYK